MADDNAAGSAEGTSSESQEASTPAEPVETEALAEQETEPAEPSESGTSQIEPSSEPPEVLPESAPTPPEAPPEPQTAHAEAETAHSAPNEPLSEKGEAPVEQRQRASRQSSDTVGIRARRETALQKKRERIREKIDTLMTLFTNKDSITNDDVEKLLRVSDATATRYLQRLEREDRIVQVGTRGRGVAYRKR